MPITPKGDPGVIGAGVGADVPDRPGTEDTMSTSQLHGEHLGPLQDIWDVWDLPPVTVGRDHYGPRHNPVNGTPDPARWRPGMPSGKNAWDAFRVAHRTGW